ncbi:MAG: esterase family protein [Spirochaetaceae bacterium]|jgi:S-formylglutathione hydrolase FrmB|nr:esterase family protein [Spirochaetaceae bacterium]
MSFFTGTIFSEALHMDTSVGVILPQDSRCHRHPGVLGVLREGIKPCKRPKTLVLLHGLSDNYSVWEHRTSILRYAEEYDIAVLMPEVQRSFYHNMKNGPAYFTYISEELPALAADMFNVSVRPDDLYIAGLSMGGYGAFYAALSRPEKYAGAGCFSSACDIRAIIETEDYINMEAVAGLDGDRRGIFGESFKVPDSGDLFYLVTEAAKKPKKPAIFMTCGTEDFVYDSNVRLRDHIQATGAFRFTYEEWPGIHEWRFWDISIQKMLNHFLS